MLVHRRDIFWLEVAWVNLSATLAPATLSSFLTASLFLMLQNEPPIGRAHHDG
jgi:hypothetical protein